MPFKRIGYLLLLTMLLFGMEAWADGNTIDKVYHPYVQLLEKEFEYRALYQQDSKDKMDGGFRHKLGYGLALSDRFFAELYLIAMDQPGAALEVEAYEAEFKWQLTEQGEHDNDWGLLFELEKEREESVWEANATLIALHEWSNWIATGNLTLGYEWGQDITNELEVAFAGQLRRRNREYLEPAVEVYLSEDVRGVGPVLTGLWRLGEGNKLNWEFGAIVGTNRDTADINWKLNIEYEFQ